MSLSELNNCQINQLKQNYLMEENNQKSVGTSYGELADADSLVSMEQLRERYGNVDFVEDDFSH